PYNNLGTLYYSQRKFNDADSQFRRAAQRDPQNAIVRKNLHATRYARENTRAAREVADELAKKQPLLIGEVVQDYVGVLALLPQDIGDQALDHARRGDVYMARKQYDDAIIEYKKSIALDRYDASVTNRLGIAYLQARKLEEAEQQYRATLRLDRYYSE